MHEGHDNEQPLRGAVRRTEAPVRTEIRVEIRLPRWQTTTSTKPTKYERPGDARRYLGRLPAEASVTIEARACGPWQPVDVNDLTSSERLRHAISGSDRCALCGAAT